MKTHLINGKELIEPEQLYTYDAIIEEMQLKCNTSDCVKLNCSNCIFSKENKDEYILLYKNIKPNKEFTHSDEEY